MGMLVAGIGRIHAGTSGNGYNILSSCSSVEKKLLFSMQDGHCVCADDYGGRDCSQQLSAVSAV